MSHHAEFGKGEVAEKTTERKPKRAPRKWNRAARRRFLSHRWGQNPATGMSERELVEYRRDRRKKRRAVRESRRRNRK